MTTSVIRIGHPAIQYHHLALSLDKLTALGTIGPVDHLRGMTTNFLHEDKNVPPDEAYERDAPSCPNCGQQMWLVRVAIQLSDRGTQSARQYECAHCGAKTSQHATSDLITPLSS